MLKSFHFLMLSFLVCSPQATELPRETNTPLNLTHSLCYCSLDDVRNAFAGYVEIDNQRYAKFQAIMEPIIRRSVDALIKEDDYNLLLNNPDRARCAFPEKDRMVLIRPKNTTPAREYTTRVECDSSDHQSVSLNYQYVIQPVVHTGNLLTVNLFIRNR